MARASDQFRSSDVTFWGLAALVACAFSGAMAVLGALVPDTAFAGLHASRAKDDIIASITAELAALEAEAGRLSTANAALEARLALSEQAAAGVAARVGTVEAALPALIAKQDDLDTRMVTGSVGNPKQPGDGTTFFGTGGAGQQASASSLEAALPPIAATWGVAVGRPVAATDAPTEWTRVTGKAGAVLLGLRPLFGADAAGSGRLVAGPVADETRALALCNEMARADIACMPALYEGAPLP